MHLSKHVAAVVLMIAVSLYCRGAAQAAQGAWPSNKGEVCFLNQSNNEFVRLVVIHTLGDHYTVQGIVTEESGNMSLVNGNAFVDGDRILMNVRSSGYDASDGESYGFAGRVELDAATLNGWARGIGFHCVEGDDPECGLESDGVQDLAHVPCP